MNILVTLDEKYIFPLKVMLISLFQNNGQESFNVYMIYSHISHEKVDELKQFCHYYRSEFYPVYVENDAFADAPVFGHYTKAMYYRLLAYKLLPATVNKVLYLDPDILVINPIRSLYEVDITNYLYAGAVHTNLIKISDRVNKIRLKINEAEGYFNSGVLLMNLELQRKRIKEEDIFSYAKEHQNELILPDQDILNGLYGNDIRALDDSICNYDARYYNTYNIISAGEKDIDWVMKNTVILHFCGKNKPWNKSYTNRFGVLYRHYMRWIELQG